MTRHDQQPDDERLQASGWQPARPDVDDTPEQTAKDETTDETGKRNRPRYRDPDAEAGARRKQLRETEQARDAAAAERDQLAARLDAMQRRDVERIAATRLAQPDDLWTIGGTALADLLDDGGDVDETTVTAAIDALLEARPGLAKPAPRKFPDMGGGQRGGPVDAPPSWRDVLRTY